MKYLTPRMVFGVASLTILTALTILYPKWLILPLVMSILTAMGYLTYVVVWAVIDNKWPW